MTTTTDMEIIQDKIRSLRKTAEELKEMGGDFPALYRNIIRILASIRMLELNVPEI